MCENKELLVGYLYDDLEEDQRRAFDAHLAACANCRVELEGLRATRVQLAWWSPPEAELGFRIVRQSVEPSTVVPFRRRWVPAFGLAAAAVLVLAAATAIANLEVRYDSDGFVVRTGWTRGEAQTAAVPSAASPQLTAASSRAEFEALDGRLRELETALATQPSSRNVQVSSGPRMSDAEMLRRVREIVAEAESRQEVAVAQRLLQVVRDFDAQRRTDLALLRQGTEQYHGLTNAELAQTREHVNQLMRVATRQEK